jgi:ABC-type sugar transport system substrate-binding protein
MVVRVAARLIVMLAALGLATALLLGAMSMLAPAASAEARLRIDMTPASCSGPITADLEAGQVNRNRGS